MRIRLLSDLHLEGYGFNYKYNGEDIIILAGDIHTRNRHHEFLNTLPDHIPIIMVAGNHEYYHGCFQEVNRYLKDLEEIYPNFFFLNNEGDTFGDLEIFGGTMFTDFLLHGDQERWFAEHDAKRYIADFHHIEVEQLDPYQLNNEKWQWTIQDHKDQYALFNREFDRWVKDKEGKKRICVSHFMPSQYSISERFKNSNLNPYFTANNEQRVQLVDFWFHGHTHDSFHYTLEETHVICNPKGYGLENESGFNRDLIIEV